MYSCPCRHNINGALCISKQKGEPKHMGIDQILSIQVVQCQKLVDHSTTSTVSNSISQPKKQNKKNLQFGKESDNTTKKILTELRDTLIITKILFLFNSKQTRVECVT